MAWRRRLLTPLAWGLECLDALGAIAGWPWLVDFANARWLAVMKTMGG